MATRTSSPMTQGDSQPATRQRYWVIVFAVTLAILAYIDRVCISYAAPLISRDLGLNREQMGSVFAAFALAYALFEIPGGWLGDWMGPRRVLLRITVWWSVFTAITGGMWSYGSIWVVRFLFGAGKRGASRISPRPSRHGCLRLSACGRRESCGPSRAGAEPSRRRSCCWC